MASGELAEYARGAEAILYRTRWLGLDAIVKVRLPKPYRHPRYDELFRFRRTVTEAKIMAHLRRLGLNVPAVLFVDPGAGMIVMEFIEGRRLSALLDTLGADEIERIACSVGRQVCIMHRNGIYHGDLTIANIITDGSKAYIIDFGLAGYSRDVEEYAIDVHLLSRSLEALSPDAHGVFIGSFRECYRDTCGGEFTERVFERMREIRLRGRYVEERLKRRVSLDRYV